MKNILPVCATLAMVLGMTPLGAVGQTSAGGAPQPAPTPESDKFDVALNFTYKVAKIASTTNRFVLPGGSLDAAYNFGGKVKALGLVVDINGESKSNIEPGVGLTQFSVMGGARYKNAQCRGRVVAVSRESIIRTSPGMIWATGISCGGLHLY